MNNDVTRFDRGETLGLCMRCGNTFSGYPERCPTCGESFESTGSATVTSVDRASGTIVATASLGPKDPHIGLGRAERRKAERADRRRK